MTTREKGNYMTPSERDTARAQQIVIDQVCPFCWGKQVRDWCESCQKLAVDVAHALTEVRAALMPPASEPSPNEVRAAVAAAVHAGWNRDDITLAGFIALIVHQHGSDTDQLLCPICRTAQPAPERREEQG